MQTLAANHNAAALGHGVIDMTLHLVQRCGLNQRTLGHTGFKAVAHLQRPDSGSKQLHKALINTVLHINAVGAHASLACIAVLAGDGPFNGRLQVRIIEHDERRIAPQLQRQLLDRGRALSHQQAPDFGATREAQVTHHIAFAQLLAHGNAAGSIAGEHIEHTGRETGASRQLGDGQGRQRCQLGRFDDHGATCRQSRRHLAGDHGQREIPRRDGRTHTDRLANHQQTPVVVELRQGFAIAAFGLLGKPLDKAGSIDHLALGFGKGLALFGGHDAGDIVLVLDQQLEPAHQHGMALLARLGSPARQHRIGRRDGLLGLRNAQAGHIGQMLARRGIMHGETA